VVAVVVTEAAEAARLVQVEAVLAVLVQVVLAVLVRQTQAAEAAEEMLRQEELEAQALFVFAIATHLTQQLQQLVHQQLLIQVDTAFTNGQEAGA
jgi:hypothetical protein